MKKPLSGLFIGAILGLSFFSCQSSGNQEDSSLRGSGDMSAEAPAPDFGPNVVIFNPKMSPQTMQEKLDTIFAAQRENQFGPERYAILFKPGNYDLRVNVGFYTQVLGLGLSPDDTHINGRLQVDASWFGGNATQNFWRSAENLAVNPKSGGVLWAVSQAAPLRRVHIQGDLRLSDSGWSSGGFMADSIVDGTVYSGSQQQWISRNSRWSSWVGGAWNMVFVGDDNAPDQGFPNPPNTTIDRTPKHREKPFLYVDSNGEYNVFVPAPQKDSHGPSWSPDKAAGRSIALNQFYIAKADSDGAATINAALAAGKNLLLTPGVYAIDDTIRITRPDTIVLGLGMATLQSRGTVPTMTVDDVDGVTIAGILFDAGTDKSPVQLEIGSPGSSAVHSDNPSSLFDLFFRVGGSGPGQTAKSLVINSNSVIADNLWIWRADHGNGVGWTVNPADTGLVVNGDDATIYGLAVEHFQNYQTLWNGNGGSVYFYQSEEPYDVPSQDAWMDGKKLGFASYKVGDSVKTHNAYGLGIYCFFNANPSVQVSHAIEAPSAVADGGMFRDMVTVSLGGVGQINHILNERGATANAAATNATLSQ